MTTVLVSADTTEVENEALVVAKLREVCFKLAIKLALLIAVFAWYDLPLRLVSAAGASRSRPVDPIVSMVRREATPREGRVRGVADHPGRPAH